MEAHLDIVSNCQEGAVVALLNGRLDANQIPAFDQWLDQQLDAQENTLVLDMSRLSYISSSGLRVICQAPARKPWLAPWCPPLNGSFPASPVWIP